MRFAPLLLLVFVAGCATASDEQRLSLRTKPIDCTTAKEDIAALEAALPSNGERALSAAQTLTPVGALATVVLDSYSGRFAVLTGQTEEELVARIEDIRKTCGIVAFSGDTDGS